jgi:hypothetical protein
MKTTATYTITDLYRTEDNCYVYVIGRDIRNGKVIYIDWDISDEEIDELVKKFENGTLTEDDINGEEWYDEEVVFENDRLCGTEHIA